MKQSAGILLYKIKQQNLFVLLVHPGGPFFASKDLGAWGIPKGEFTEEEEPLAAARREFLEETGHAATGDFLMLKPLLLRSGKRVHAWACEGDLDAATIISNTCTIEWPPHSGQTKEIPEIDRGDWFSVDMAMQKISVSQQGFISELEDYLFQQKRIQHKKGL